MTSMTKSLHCKRILDILHDKQPQMSYPVQDTPLLIILMSLMTL